MLIYDFFGWILLTRNGPIPKSRINKSIIDNVQMEYIIYTYIF